MSDFLQKSGNCDVSLCKDAGSMHLSEDGAKDLLFRLAKNHGAGFLDALSQRGKQKRICLAAWLFDASTKEGCPLTFRLISVVRFGSMLADLQPAAKEIRRIYSCELRRSRKAKEPFRWALASVSLYCCGFRINPYKESKVMEDSHD
jgi:hypothetical protein